MERFLTKRNMNQETKISVTIRIMMHPNLLPRLRLRVPTFVWVWTDQVSKMTGNVPSTPSQELYEEPQSPTDKALHEGRRRIRRQEVVWVYQWSGELPQKNLQWRQLQPDYSNRLAYWVRDWPQYNAPHQQPLGEPDTGVPIRGIHEPLRGYEGGRVEEERRMGMSRARGIEIRRGGVSRRSGE